MRNEKLYTGIILAIVLVVGIFIGYALKGDNALMGGTSNYTSDTNIFDGDVTIGGDITLTGDLAVSGSVSLGGISEDWTIGDCNDATTTIMAAVNPWTATSYIDKFILIIDGVATTSGYITCGTSSVATGLAADPTDLLIDDYLLATSTTANLMNGLAGGARSATSGFGLPGTNSEDIIVWGSGEYVACYVDYTGAASSAVGFTQSTNTFDCSYKIHSFK